MNHTRLYASRRLVSLALAIVNDDSIAARMGASEISFWDAVESLVASRFETTGFEPEILTFDQRDEVIRELLRYLEVVALEPGMIPRFRK